jgi:O-acetyl-ADP-ribose deacetylase (regulator of RNase III)
LVANAVTQKNFGRSGRYVSYDAVRLVMQRANVLCKAGGITEIAMPKIGAGLAGGDWDIIAQIIEEESTNFQPVVYEWDQDERGGK